ncbi:MAG: cadherin-like domain-containing protein [Rhodocyclaceae bacterium]
MGGSEFLVQTRLTGNAISPTVGMAANGSYTIAWAESSADGNNYGILMRRFKAAGTALGNDELVNLTTNNRQDEPDIAMLTSGDFVITWVSDKQDGNDEGVFLRAYTHSGVAASGEVAVNQYTSGSQDHPAIAMNNTGELVVTWVGERAVGDDDDINARRFSWPEGARLNTAPVLDDSATPALDAIAEDSGIPSGTVGTLIDDLVSLAGSGGGLQNVTDTDAGATTGIALLAADSSHGSWYYSLDNGASWTLLDTTTLGSANALLLAADGQTRLAFAPVANFNSAGGDYPEIRFRAWDRSSGTNGGLADTTGNGGSTAFSVATDSARLNVNAVNDPPVISTNLLVIGEGQTVVLSPAMLAGTDVEDAPGTLLYSVTSVTGGFFARVASPTNATLSFSQQEVIDGAIQFVHDGGETAPTYTLTLTDTEDLSSAPSAANVAFSNVNDAPVLADVPLSFSILQNNGAPTGVVGVRITALVTLAGSGSGPQNVSDGDVSAVAGIAITAADTTHGIWYYSIDDGSNWLSLDLASLPAGEARLLAADARTRLYFQHTDAATGTFANSLVFHAWDGSSGSNGGSANPLPGGGSSAFSTATDGVDLIIIDINDAPVLDTNIPITVVATEDAPPPAGAVGFTTASLVSFVGSGSGAQNTTDPDAGALSGVALTGADTSGGNWWYSLDGGNNWAQLPAGLSDTNALLMANDGLSRLYFQSTVANAFGTTPSALSFKAWDQTAGSDGQTGVDTTTGTAFSANSHSATLDLQAVNDVPTVSTNTLAISEGATVVLGTANLASSDVESPASGLTYTVKTVSGGRFAWVGTPGVAITSFTQADIDANLVQFEHDGGEAAPAYTLTLSDGAATLGPFAGSVSFTPVNDRPVLTATGNATLSLDEDSGLPVGAVGVPIEAMVGLNGTGPGNVTDPDSNPIGIAINYADTSNGQWFYTLNDGTTWIPLGPISSTSARLLLADGNTRIGFAPTPGYNGSTPAALHFHAWDGSSGAHGGLGDPGSGTAFSTADDTLTLIVRPVNDAPIVVPVALASSAEDTPRRITQADLLAGASDLESDPLIATDLAVTSGSGTLSNNGDGSWTFTPATDWSGAVTFSFQVDDGTDSTPNTASLLVTPVNDAPSVTPLSAQTITPGGGFGPLSFTVGDAESAASTLIVTARSSNPAVLPDSAIVLSGSGATRSISVTPGHAGGSGVAQIILEISDGVATTTGQFSVTAPAASNASDTPTTTPPAADPTPDAVAAPPPTAEPPTPDTPAGSATPAPPSQPAAPPLVQDAQLEIQNTVPNGDPADTATTDNRPGDISTLSISLSTTDVLALLYTPSEITIQSSVDGQVSSAFREARLEQAFAQLRQGADEEAIGLQQGIGVSVVTGAGLTIGYVAWLIRGGVLLTSLLSTMPAWRLLDPLPILNSSGGKHRGDDDDSLEALVDTAPPDPEPPRPLEPTPKEHAPS